MPIPPGPLILILLFTRTGAFFDGRRRVVVVIYKSDMHILALLGNEFLLKSEPPESMTLSKVCNAYYLKRQFIILFSNKLGQ